MVKVCLKIHICLIIRYRGSKNHREVGVGVGGDSCGCGRNQISNKGACFCVEYDYVILFI
jgi:hypothetical protein